MTDEDDFIKCKYHPSKKAKRFCDLCKEFICNSCAFDKHFSHITQIKTMNDLYADDLAVCDEFSKTKQKQLDVYLKAKIDLFMFILNYNFDKTYSDSDSQALHFLDYKFDNYICNMINAKKYFRDMILNRGELILTILNTNHKMIHNLQNIIEKNVKDKDFTKKINVLYEKMKKEGNVDSVLNMYNEFGNIINVIFKNDYQGCIANFEFYKKIGLMKHLIKVYNDKLMKDVFSQKGKEIQEIVNFLYEKAKENEDMFRKEMVEIINSESEIPGGVADYKYEDYHEEEEFGGGYNKGNNRDGNEKKGNGFLMEDEIDFNPQKLDRDLGNGVNSFLSDIDFRDAVKEFEMFQKESPNEQMQQQPQHSQPQQQPKPEIQSQHYQPQQQPHQQQPSQPQTQQPQLYQQQPQIQSQQQPQNHVVSSLNTKNTIEQLENNNIRRSFTNPKVLASCQNAHIPSNNIQQPQETQESKPTDTNPISGGEQANTAVIDNGYDKLNEFYKYLSTNPSDEEMRSHFRSLPLDIQSLVETVSFISNTNKMSVYNPYLKSIIEIEITFPNNPSLLIPAHHSLTHTPSSIYLSGGKSTQMLELSTFYRFTRKGHSSYEITVLPNLKDKRHLHASVYIPSRNSIAFISGSRVKSCEMYDISTNTFSVLPPLQFSREKCGAMVINDNLIYAFLGYDKVKSKFLTTIDKLDLRRLTKWENIKISGDQNVLKKQAFATIPYQDDTKRGVLIVGGVNALRNECREVLLFNLETNVVQICSFNLPLPLSFTNCVFNNFGYKEGKKWYNISESHKGVIFNESDLKFKFES